MTDGTLSFVSLMLRPSLNILEIVPLSMNKNLNKKLDGKTLTLTTLALIYVDSGSSGTSGKITLVLLSTNENTARLKPRHH